MKTQSLTFAAQDGSARELQIDLPIGPRQATALIAHCFACSDACRPSRRIARRLTEAGIAVARLDFTGLNSDSAGRMALTLADLMAAAHALAEAGQAPDLLIGHSLAGAAVLRAGAELDPVRAVVTLGAPFAADAGHRNFIGRLEEAREVGWAEADIGGQTFRVSNELLDDIQADRLTPAIHGLNAALLVMHAPRDQVVGIGNAQSIFAAALHPKSFVTLDDADHLLTDAADAEYAAGVIAAWATRYLGLEPTVRHQSVPAHPAANGVVRVTELDPDGYVQEVVNGPDHQFLSDEPVKVGGTNEGPNPYALLKAALGSCTSMTMRMYARVKKWPVTGISVEVTHEKVPVEGEKDDRGRPLKLDTFTRRITLEGELTDDQRARLVEIADRCPVHMTLHRASRIETLLTA